MLVPAMLYKDEIEANMQKNLYSYDMFFYTGYVSGYNFGLANDNSDYKYAIINNVGDVIGYFAYSVDFYSQKACCFNLYSFDKGNPIIGFDVYKEMKKLINEYKLHKITWRMVKGNPVEKHYDNFCFKHNGIKHILKDEIKDKYGNYHDDILYEIIF